MAFGLKILPLPPSQFPLLILNSAFQKLVTENTRIDSWWCWLATALRKRVKDHFIDFSFFLELLLFSFHFFFFLSWQIYFEKKKRMYEFIAVWGCWWVATEIKVLCLLNRCAMESASSLLSVSKPCAEGTYWLGKTFHSQARGEPELEKVTLNTKNGHRSCVSRLR